MPHLISRCDLSAVQHQPAPSVRGQSDRRSGGHTDAARTRSLHHNPKTGKDKKFDGWGLIDTEDLFAAVKPRRHVKAMVFGHTHHWGVDQIDGIHLINLPALGRVFQKHEPLGWVDATLSPNGVKLELRALDAKHKAHGETHQLKWRA